MVTEERTPLRLIGSSDITRRLDADINAAASSRAKILITGETGAGKDVVARLIHLRGIRAQSRLSTVNCAGIPDNLLESELFGHVRGSFTGAFRDKPGLFEAADRGTAFLDEAGEMSLRMQGMLLRFLETGELQRVGADAISRRVDVRIIAATNRDLRERIAAGAFREDLFYRLNVICIHVRPLRERPEDIRDLLEHFFDAYSERHRTRVRELSPAALDTLMAYRWPGNVRELKNVVERLVVQADSGRIEVDDLPEECRGRFETTTVSAGAADEAAANHGLTSELMRRMVDQGESFWSAVWAPFIERNLAREQLRAVIRAGLERTSGNYKLVAALFNLPPDDYKRFLSVLRKHHCKLPFQAFRTLPTVMSSIPERAFATRH
jgi:two-component system, NtrC family, response regulator HydG